MECKEIYALINQKYIKESTSGGAFLTISKTFFDLYPDGVVMGTCFDKDMSLHYYVADNLEECYRFTGSKYIKADLSGVFNQVKNYLNKNVHVFFIGIPCQLDALKKYLKANTCDDSNLVCVDLICHGTPSDVIWHQFVDEIQSAYKSKVTDFKFRTKIDKSNPYYTVCEFENGRIIRDSHLTSSYNQLFVKKLILNRSCLSCRYRMERRVGDITLGDFWGVEKLIPSLRSLNGVSQVLINTAKGSSLFSNVRESANADLSIYEIEVGDKDIPKASLTGKADIPKHYEEFWDDYEKKGFEYAWKKYSDASFGGVFVYAMKRMVRRLRVNRFLSFSETNNRKK